MLSPIGQYQLSYDLLEAYKIGKIIIRLLGSNIATTDFFLSNWTVILLFALYWKLTYVIINLTENIPAL